MSDALYDTAVLIDPLSKPVEEEIANEVESKDASKEEITEGMVERVVALLKMRADAYKERGEQADAKGSTVTAKAHIAVASELAYLSGKLKSGQIEELEKTHK